MKRPTNEDMIARRADAKMRREAPQNLSDSAQVARAWFRYGFVCGIRAEQRRIKRARK